MNCELISINFQSRKDWEKIGTICDENNFYFEKLRHWFCFSPNPKQLGFMLLDDNKCIGFVIGESKDYYKKLEKLASLDFLFILKPYRRKGYASFLLARFGKHKLICNKRIIIESPKKNKFWEYLVKKKVVNVVMKHKEATIYEAKSLVIPKT